MAFLDRFRRNRDQEQRLVTSSASIPPNSAGFEADAGVVVSERTALQSIAVYACVQLLADSVAVLPMDAYKKRGDLRVSVEPQPSLVRQPFMGLTNFEWLFQTMTSLALRGNSYHVVAGRDANEYVTDLQPIHPDWVNIIIDQDTGQYRYSIGGEPVATADIVHIRRFSMPGYPFGLSPIEKAAQGIGMALAAERYGARYFGQSANPSAILTTDQQLTQAQATDAMKRWNASHGGKRHPAFLGGGVKYQAITISPNESQFLQTRELQTADIARLFRIPPHMIGQTDRTTSWGTGIEQQSIGFVRYTLTPWLKCLEDALSQLLPRGQYVRFNVDALLRADTTARFLAYTQARNAGWLNVNEIRALEDLPPVENGDDYLQPLNMGPLGSDPLAQSEQPQGGPDA